MLMTSPLALAHDELTADCCTRAACGVKSHHVPDDEEIQAKPRRGRL